VRVADLEAARRGAVEAALSKAQFLANMSHEIRTPMNGILGMAELLARTTLDTEQLQMATTIRSSAESLLAVLNDVLDYSKIEAGKVDLEAADFDLWQVVDDCAGLLHSQAEQKGVELMTFVDPRLWRTHSGDQGRVRQVLLNLLTNAVKFTLEGEVVLSADLVDEREDQQVVRISVRDTGIGISDQALRRLFSPFSQADASTTRRFGGTGLGLSICRRLVELMGGRVDVESVPDKGSTFWFELCLRRGAIENTRPRASDVDLSKCSLLIVDYNETNRQLMVMQLAPTRIGIDVADNAISAIEVLRRATGSGCPFTMAVIDVAMPGIDGMQLAHAIRNDSEIRAMPVVLVSSLGARPGSEAMNRAGVFRWLSKPLAAGRLLQVVRDMALVRQPAGNTQRHGDAMQVLGPGNQLAGLRLLVAEDNEINRRVIAGMLRRIGCEVTFAVDGREAVQLVEQREFDLVFMDCQMPEMDGFEATRRIRQMGAARAEVPSVALTANVLASDRDACQRAGMSDFLAKPVKLDVLRAAVQRWGRPPVAATPLGPTEGGARPEDVARSDDEALRS
jgi:CheY-like chemotaxis protein/anti-sigma regulatory factor (Ser/Thr protein kinase)